MTNTMTKISVLTQSKATFELSVALQNAILNGHNFITK